MFSFLKNICICIIKMDILNNLLFNIQTIASIPKGKKISTAKEFIVIDEESVVQGLWRRRYNDSRYKAVSLICREVHIVIEISTRIMDSRSLYNIEVIKEPIDDLLLVQKSTRLLRIKELKKIRNSLRACVYGIDNLCETYNADANVVGHLNPLVVEIEKHVTLITELLRL